MKYKKLKLSAVTLLVLGLSISNAQEANTTTGGSIFGSGGSVCYSIGQVGYITNSAINGSVSQGVQQPYEISIVTEIDEAKNITLQSSVYPNPAIEFVTLKVETNKMENLIYQLFDINGKLLENKKIEGNETNIFVNNLVPSTYLLKTIQNNKTIKVFKIIKK